jgi:hypothetical protein
MTDASWIERSALIALMAASLALFWLRFRKVLGTIRGSRATPDFEIAPLGPRIRQWLWEVVAQGKVIGQRPLPGLAHAFVFWGFCAFALATLNHLASPFGARFLSGETAFGRFYLGFVAVWAVAVAVAIAGLFIRRFFVRPVWLGQLSPESGAIALLIFLLMATYVGGLWLPPATLAGKANWWAHTLALAIFLPLIPHTKHLHLALSPVTVFLRRAGFSRIPPLGSTPSKPIPAWNAAAAPSIAPPSIRGRFSTPSRSFSVCVATSTNSDRPAKPRCWAGTSPKRPRSSAPPAAPVSFSVPWAFSTCR